MVHIGHITALVTWVDVVACNITLCGSSTFCLSVICIYIPFEISTHHLDLFFEHFLDFINIRRVIEALLYSRVSNDTRSQSVHIFDIFFFHLLQDKRITNFLGRTVNLVLYRSDISCTIRCVDMLVREDAYHPRVRVTTNLHKHTTMPFNPDFRFRT